MRGVDEVVGLEVGDGDIVQSEDYHPETQTALDGRVDVPVA